MKTKSIYRSQSQPIGALFERAKEPAKVLCVPLDLAKKTHQCLFCNGQGKILKKPFAVDNTFKGLNHLLATLKRTCDSHRIAPKEVFFGAEDAGSYAANLLYALRHRGYLVVEVNAYEAKKHRENHQASNDKLDLLGIAKALLNRQGKALGEPDSITANLRQLCRQRRRLVALRTAVRNRMHCLIDRLFGGFCEEKNSGLKPFGKAALWLLAKRFSAEQMQARRTASLARALAARGVPQAQQVALKLKKLAACALPAPPEHRVALQVALAQQVQIYESLQKHIADLNVQIGYWLGHSPAAFLTTIRGIGVTLAAAVAAELGDLSKQRPLNNLCSYAGIVPRSKQSGGPQQAPRRGKVGKRSNHILKDYLVQSAQHLGMHGPEELRLDSERRQAAGQHAAFGIARRYLRLAKCLYKTHMAYLPHPLRPPSADPTQRALYYLHLWPSLREKWRRLDLLPTAFAKEQPLGKWRQIIEDTYEIKLNL